MPNPNMIESGVSNKFNTMRILMQQGNENPYHAAPIDEFCNYSNSLVDTNNEIILSELEYIERELHDIRSRLEALEKRSEQGTAIDPVVDQKSLEQIKSQVIHALKF